MEMQQAQQKYYSTKTKRDSLKKKFDDLIKKDNEGNCDDACVADYKLVEKEFKTIDHDYNKQKESFEAA